MWQSSPWQVSVHSVAKISLGECPQCGKDVPGRCVSTVWQSNPWQVSVQSAAKLPLACQCLQCGKVHLGQVSVHSVAKYPVWEVSAHRVAKISLADERPVCGKVTLGI